MAPITRRNAKLQLSLNVTVSSEASENRNNTSSSNPTENGSGSSFSNPTENGNDSSSSNPAQAVENITPRTSTPRPSPRRRTQEPIVTPILPNITNNRLLDSTFEASGYVEEEEDGDEHPSNSVVEETSSPGTSGNQAVANNSTVRSTRGRHPKSNNDVEHNFSNGSYGNQSFNDAAAGNNTTLHSVRRSPRLNGNNQSTAANNSTSVRRSPRTNGNNQSTTANNSSIRSIRRSPRLNNANVEGNVSAGFNGNRSSSSAANNSTLSSVRRSPRFNGNNQSDAANDSLLRSVRRSPRLNGNVEEGNVSTGSKNGNQSTSSDANSNSTLRFIRRLPRSNGDDVEHNFSTGSNAAAADNSTVHSPRRSPRINGNNQSSHAASNNSLLRPTRRRLVQRSAYIRCPAGPSKVEKEIKQLQRTTNNLLKFAPFTRIVKETILKMAGGKNFRVREEAIHALRDASEAHLITIFQTAYKCASNAKRVTLLPTDIQLVRQIMQEFGHPL